MDFVAVYVVRNCNNRHTHTHICILQEHVEKQTIIIIIIGYDGHDDKDNKEEEEKRREKQEPRGYRREAIMAKCCT